MTDIFKSLTARELEVLSLVAQGDCNKLIARKLGITEATTKVHVRMAFRRIGVNNRTQASILYNQHHANRPTVVEEAIKKLSSEIQFQRVYESGYIGHWIVNGEGYVAFQELLAVIEGRVIP